MVDDCSYLMDNLDSFSGEELWIEDISANYIVACFHVIIGIEWRLVSTGNKNALKRNLLTSHSFMLRNGLELQLTASRMLGF